MEVASGHTLSTCCTCLRRVDTDGRIQCAECFDKSIMRACARRSGRRGTAAYSFCSLCSSSCSSHRADPSRSSSVNSSSHTSSTAGRDCCPHDNPFASAVRFLPFPGRPHVVMIKNRAREEEMEVDHRRGTGVCCTENTRLAAIDSLEQAVRREDTRPVSCAYSYHAGGEAGGEANGLLPSSSADKKASARIGGHDEEGLGNCTVQGPTRLEVATLLGKNTPRHGYPVEATKGNTKTKVKPSLSKTVSMDRASAAMSNVGERPRSEHSGLTKTVRLRHNRGGSSISSFMSVSEDPRFLDELICSLSAPCSPGDGKGEQRSTKQGSTSPLWERRCFTRPTMLEINRLAVPV